METRKLELSVRDREKTVMGRAAFQRDDVERMADRLRSWALIRGETITGAPFMRLCGAVDVQVHLPVSGKMSPHLETGIEGDIAEGGPIGTIHNVPFAEVRALVESAHDWYPGLGDHRWAEFRPTGRNFGEGDLILPRRDVRRAPALAGAGVAPEAVHQ